MRLVLWLVVSLLVGCSLNTTSSYEEGAGSRNPSHGSKKAISLSRYQHWQRGGDRVVWVVPSHSYLLIHVRRGGTLATLGHDHVIVSHHLLGAIDQTKGVGDFNFNVNDLVVDEPEYRQQWHMPAHVSESSRQGTKHNMLDKVLIAKDYPEVIIHAQRLNGNEDHVGLTITMHGVSQKKIIPFKTQNLQGHVHLMGETTLTQSQFKLKPFSVLSGALTVEDQFDVRFDLEVQEQIPN